MTSRLGRLLRGAGILAILAWSLGPILIGVLTSISTQAEVQATPAVWIPKSISWDGYRALVDSHAGAGLPGGTETAAFGRAMLNSGLVTLESTAVILVLSVFSGYAFSRLRFRGRIVVLAVILATLTIPVFALVAPLFRMMAGLRLIDTQLGLVLIYLSAEAPLAIWLFYNYSREMPREPEEAALMDGCTRLGAFVRVVLPQMGSGIAALTAILLLATWGQFLIPLLFAPTLNSKPVTVLITEFVGKYTTNYPLLAAAGVLAMLPPAVVAIFLNRHIRGMLSGWSG